LIFLSVAAIAGCGTTTGERTASGALLGAGTGAALGSLSGDAGKGALIGAGAGALGGYLYDQNRKAEARRYYRNDRHGYSRNDRRYGYYHRNRYGSNEYLW
jgi:hypothetical protein